MKTRVREAIDGAQPRGHRVDRPKALMAEGCPRPAELTAVLVDAVRLVLAERAATPDEVEHALFDCGLRPRGGLVKRACMYLYYGGELRLDGEGRYLMLDPVREPALRRRAVS